ncbi:hypothetical protein BJ165DRAFT_1597550 [Panaeolus papilionaceus]|nr:hypothetical protein BJ165DRAFT_1597550 [Panaeolus papilionaceus]
MDASRFTHFYTRNYLAIIMDTPTTEYKRIKVVGSVSVKLIDRLEEARGTLYGRSVILILGPTGAGKSTFIEALDSNKSLQISSNQLEGFTQSISLYSLINVTHIGHPVYLIDVPGFADTKISEMKIVSMLKDWMKEVGLFYIFHVLYFTPVNNPRLPGSHRQVLRTFQALTGVDTSESITVVTTMWDCVWNETGRKRAESNFNQLRDEIWQEYVEEGAEILKFHNTQESALFILDKTFSRFSVPNFALVGLVRSDVTHIREYSFGSNLYNNLQQRIQILNTEIANIESDLLGAAEQDDAQLTATLTPRLSEAKKLLAIFKQEMFDFGPPLHAPPIDNMPHPQMLQSKHTHTPLTAPTASMHPQINSHRIGTFDRVLNSLKGLGRKFHQRRED